MKISSRFSITPNDRHTLDFPAEQPFFIGLLFYAFLTLSKPPDLIVHICMVVFSDLNFDYRVFREASSLHQAGHQVSIVAPAFATTPLKGWDDFEVHLISMDRSRSLRLLYPLFWRRARRLLLSVRADAYHAHDLDSLWPAARAARKRHVPLIYDSHEFWIEQSSLVHRPSIRAFWAHLERRLMRQVDRTITVSDSIARSLQERYQLETVAVLRNLPLYRPPVESRLIHAELDLDPGRFIALYQGGFLTENGLAEQIEAFAEIDGVAFVLIGGGPCEAALKAQAWQAGLQEKVYFIPRVPFGELHTYTCAADLGLCLIKGTGKSFYYSMPNKMFEYMMAGLPVLASDFPEMRSVIQQSGAGQVVDPQDIGAIRRCIQDLLGDPTRIQAYGEAALRAAQHYNWEQEADKLIQLYNEL